MNTIRLLTATTALALLPVGCGGEDTGDLGDFGESDLTEERMPLEELFQRASEEFDVPADLLKAIGYVETGWEMVEGIDEHHEGQPPAFGLMGLRGERLERGAELAGVDPDDVRWDEESNIRAAAALLDAHASELGTERAELGEWAHAVAAFSGIEDLDARRDYVTRGVYGVLSQGAVSELEGGHVVAAIEPVEVVPNYPLPEYVAHQTGTSDYPSSIWRPSPNHSARPSGAIGTIAMVIIHTCEGSYSGCWGWLRNSAAGASAHYVVSQGGEISQLVREYRKAWHIAASYSSSRNGGHDSWRNGWNSNNFTVGIEHAGYASQSSFPNSQLEASAKLVCDITRDRKIPRDRYHILGHGQLQPWNRTDPGKNWPWSHYISRVRAHCDGGGGGGTTTTGGAGFIVDSNNANNKAGLARVDVSGNWSASNYSPGYYGTGYWWADTQSVSDAAEFWFHLDKAQTKTIDAWWVAGTNRSQKTPFVAFDASGKKLGAVYRDQQRNGKRWNQLGSWSFSAGWNKIVVSRWAPDGKVVIADAIRVR